MKQAFLLFFPIIVMVSSIISLTAISHREKFAFTFQQLNRKILGQDLQIEKTDSIDERAQAQPEDLLQYKISYKNLGTTEADSVVITDIIPKYTKYNSASPPALSGSEQPAPDGRTYLKWNIGTVPANTSSDKAITLVVQIADQSQLPPGTTTLLNVIWIDNRLEHDESSDETKVTACPDLAIEKTDALETAEPGQKLTYSITYRNIGNKDAYNVTVIDFLPSHTSFNMTSDGGSYDMSAHTVTWELGIVSPGVELALWINVVIDSILPLGLTALINEAEIFTTDDECANSSANNKATDTTMVIATRNLEVTKDDFCVSANVRDTLTYVLRYQNNGNMAADGVKLIDTLPPYAQFLSASNGGIYDPTSRTITWDLNTVPPHSNPLKEWIKVVVADSTDLPEGETELINKAAISTTDPENNYADNEKSDSTIVRGIKFELHIKVITSPPFYLNKNLTTEYHSNKLVTQGSWTLIITPPTKNEEVLDNSGLYPLTPNISFYTDFKTHEVGTHILSIEATDVFSKYARADTSFEVIGPFYLIPRKNTFIPESDRQLQIDYGSKKSGQIAIRIYNVAGELVKNVFVESTEIVEGTAFWDGKNNNGILVASGVYIITLEAASETASKKIIVVR